MQAYNIMRVIREHRGNVAIWTAGLGAAALAPLLLHWSGVAAQIDNQFAALGFDAERVLFIDHILLTLLSSALAGLLFQRRGAAWIGGVLFFVTEYLVPFVQQVQHPGSGPDGQAQVLMPAALGSTVLTMLALAFLFAGAGAVIGAACGLRRTVH